MLSKNGEIRRDDGCLDYSGGESVIVYPCHGQKGNQEWQYREVRREGKIGDSTERSLKGGQNRGQCREVSDGRTKQGAV